MTSKDMEKIGDNLRIGVVTMVGTVFADGGHVVGGMIGSAGIMNWEQSDIATRLVEPPTGFETVGTGGTSVGASGGLLLQTGGKSTGKTAATKK